MIVNLVMLVQVISALIIVGLVLMQHGKGADMGAAFGSGASGSLFGASGSSNFLSKSTGVAAAIFFASTLGLAYLNSGPRLATNSLDTVVPATAPAPAAAPAASAPAASTAPAAQAPAASTPAASVPASTAPAVSVPAAAPAKSAPAASQSAPAQK